MFIGAPAAAYRTTRRTARKLFPLEAVLGPTRAPCGSVENRLRKQFRRARRVACGKWVPEYPARIRTVYARSARPSENVIGHYRFTVNVASVRPTIVYVRGPAHTVASRATYVSPRHNSADEQNAIIALRTLLDPVQYVSTRRART